MSADVVNLRRFRKAKVRTERDRDAAANRARFGRTKEEKLREKIEKVRATSALNHHRRETDADSD